MAALMLFGCLGAILDGLSMAGAFVRSVGLGSWYGRFTVVLRLVQDCD